MQTETSSTHPDRVPYVQETTDGKKKSEDQVLSMC